MCPPLIILYQTSRSWCYPSISSLAFLSFFSPAPPFSGNVHYRSAKKITRPGQLLGILGLRGLPWVYPSQLFGDWSHLLLHTACCPCTLHDICGVIWHLILCHSVGRNIGRSLSLIRYHWIVSPKPTRCLHCLQCSLLAASNLASHTVYSLPMCKVMHLGKAGNTEYCFINWTRRIHVHHIAENRFTFCLLLIIWKQLIYCSKLAHRNVDMSSFPGMYDMSYLYSPLIFVLFLNIQHVPNWLVFLVFQLLWVH